MNDTELGSALLIFGCPGAIVVVAILLCVVTLGVAASRRSVPPATRHYADLVRIERLEHRVAAIMAHLGISEPAEPPANPIRDLARAGNKIGAIKLYREQHGVGLREAKEAVEAIMEGETPDGRPRTGMP